MNKIELYDKVELLETLVDGIDFISNSSQNITKGSIGIVIELIDDESVLVEFSSKIYKDPVSVVKISKLKRL